MYVECDGSGGESKYTVRDITQLWGEMRQLTEGGLVQAPAVMTAAMGGNQRLQLLLRFVAKRREPQYS